MLQPFLFGGGMLTRLTPSILGANKCHDELMPFSTCCSLSVLLWHWEGETRVKPGIQVSIVKAASATEAHEARTVQTDWTIRWRLEMFGFDGSLGEEELMNWHMPWNHCIVICILLLPTVFFCCRIKIRYSNTKGHIIIIIINNNNNTFIIFIIIIMYHQVAILVAFFFQRNVRFFCWGNHNDGT